MPRVDLHDLFPIERGTDVPDEELQSWTSRARRDFLRGKSIVPADWGDEHGIDGGPSTAARLQLEAMGFRFHVENLGHRVPGQGRPMNRYTIANLDHQPTEADIDRAIDRNKATKKKPAKSTAVVASKKPPAQPAPQPEPPPLPALPGLGQAVSIYALVQNDDESITIGLRNGSKKWMATLTGVIEA
jgi:hypothetical protein